MKTTKTPATFELGAIVATPNALTRMEGSGQAAIEFIRRHAACDWSECQPEDAKENQFSLEKGFRIFSVYKTHSNETLWVITEADRSSTCILCPEDY